MRTIAEAGLAVLVLVLLGTGFWLYTGEELVGDSPTDTTIAVEVDPEAAARGMQLANDTGCLACHSVDGATGTGPTWKGVAGSSRPLESGESVTADAAYLFNSIVDPGSQVLAGYTDVMPSDYVDQLTEAEINDLVAYIQSLAD